MTDNWLWPASAVPSFGSMVYVTWYFPALFGWTVPLVCTSSKTISFPSRLV
ncbi:CTF2A; monooxygenase, partial [Listeria ivanovii FSL F6-596]